MNDSRSSHRKRQTRTRQASGGLECFHDAVQRWFRENFATPTQAQQLAWPKIAEGLHTLLLAPTGSGKTLSAFLVAINRLMFPPASSATEVTPQGTRVLYISPLKALGVDVERNLRAPIAGIQHVAIRDEIDHHVPSVAVRSGDTAAHERQRMRRDPPDILITTPESLYLMLTSQVRETLRFVDTVIIDEIHSLARTKRGAHLFLSLERLEQLRDGAAESKIQRIGLSATQRPLDEIARLLGGGEATADPDQPVVARPVEIVEAGRRKPLDLTIEVPVDDMARLSEPVERSGAASAGPTAGSIWPAIHPRLVELIRAHQVTIIFVNSRRLAERLSTAINELAEETIAMAHHGSIAKDTRLDIEDRLKRGALPAIVATSSLELGIDMGAVDLVIQIEAPPSIASGLQRVGRAGHQVDARSKGIIFPKFRGDLLACSAAAKQMLIGHVEETFYPRNPLDVLAQQIVAMVALEPQSVNDLYQRCRCSAPFFDLPRSAFEGVLDLLSGRYPSEEFAELRSRVVWDRIGGMVSPRKGSQRIAVANAGTIPDRGLYGVFLADGGAESTKRVGELDEEMVFETKPGDVFLLGASSWRVVDITHDRVLVVPAPGEPGRMPFWRGDGPGRPLEFGQAIGQLARELVNLPEATAVQTLVNDHRLDERAARNLFRYLQDQRAATEEVPSDRTIVLESFVDDLGDWRVLLMTPFGARIHAPWAMAVSARLRRELDQEIDLMWSDDGIVFRLPETDEPPRVDLFLPASDEIEEIVVKELGNTALFATHFRENAARALLLPKRQPQRRTPLWLQRRKAADLLKVASRYERFPILLETYRECLKDVFDIGGLRRILAEVERRQIRIHRADTQVPSPFAASLMFNYTANFLYEGDAPLAERRTAALALDHAQLRELLGAAELRELLDAEVIEQVALEAQRLDGKYPPQDQDGLHDMLQSLGDLSTDEVVLRCGDPSDAKDRVIQWLQQLEQQRRAIRLRIAGDMRWVAAEDAGRYRDALGISLPVGLPDAFLESPADPLAELVARYARTHGPFQAEHVAARYALGIGPIRAAIKRLVADERLLEGEFLPRGRGLEWCDPAIMRRLKQRSLARLRQEVEPVEPATFAKFLTHWQGLRRPRRGLDGLLDVIEQLQGTPIPASDLERSVLPGRISGYQPSDLDELCAAGEVIWRGIDPIGTHDGRVALYLTDHAQTLAPPAEPPVESLESAIVELLEQQAALFFDSIHGHLKQFPPDVSDALWRLVWQGLVTNDTLAPLRSLLRGTDRKRSKSRSASRGFRSRRSQRVPGSEGRWSLFHDEALEISATERQTAIATQLVERYGVVTRDLVMNEGVFGGYAALYPIYRAMEDAGRLRRGYFIAGQGASQFAVPGADDQLRERIRDDEDQSFVLAAADPANPYGSALRWPETPENVARPQRAAGARVILLAGELIGYLSRSGKRLTTFLPNSEPERGRAWQSLIKSLQSLPTLSQPLEIDEIDGCPALTSSLGSQLVDAGFAPYRNGLYLRRVDASGSA